MIGEILTPKGRFAISLVDNTIDAIRDALSYPYGFEAKRTTTDWQIEAVARCEMRQCAISHGDCAEFPFEVITVTVTTGRYPDRVWAPAVRAGVSLELDEWDLHSSEYEGATLTLVYEREASDE